MDAPSSSLGTDSYVHPLALRSCHQRDVLTADFLCSLATQHAPNQAIRQIPDKSDDDSDEESDDMVIDEIAYAGSFSLDGRASAD